MRDQVCHSEATDVESEYFPNNGKGQSKRKRKVPVGDDCEEPLKSAQKSSGNHFTYDFYNVPCEELSKKLLGKVLVRHLADGNVLRGRIVETEAYLGGGDMASHSCQGKRTERNTPMFMKAGTSYVYLTYGMYNCINISSQGKVLHCMTQPIETVL